MCASTWSTTTPNSHHRSPHTLETPASRPRTRARRRPLSRQARDVRIRTHRARASPRATHRAREDARGRHRPRARSRLSVLPRTSTRHRFLARARNRNNPLDPSSRAHERDVALERRSVESTRVRRRRRSLPPRCPSARRACARRLSKSSSNASSSAVRAHSPPSRPKTSTATTRPHSSTRVDAPREPLARRKQISC